MKKNIIIVILSILVLILGGYILYDKVFDKEERLICYGCNINLDEKPNIFKNSVRNPLYTKLQTIFGELQNNNHPKGLFLHGPYGCGKTYILKFYARKLVDSGYTMMDILDKIIWEGLVVSGVMSANDLANIRAERQKVENMTEEEKQELVVKRKNAVK